MNNILRYEGKAKLGMIGLLVGAILNALGDPLFMFVFKMGIAGAGLSTALSQIVSFVVLLSMFLRRKTTVCLSWRNMLPAELRMGDIATTGMPSLLRQGLNSLTAILLNNSAGIYGDAAIAAMSINSSIGHFIFSIALGVGQGFQPVSAFNHGAGNYGRVRRGYWFTFVLAESLMAVLAGVVYLLAPAIIAVFRDDPAVLTVGIRALRLQCGALFFLPLCMVTEMLYQSTGHKIGAAILSCMRSGLFFCSLITDPSTCSRYIRYPRSSADCLYHVFFSGFPFCKAFFRVASVEER